MPQLSVKYDVPPEMDGKDRALTPPQLFLASLASCILAFVVNYCNNVGINTEDMSVDLSYDKLEEPKRFANLKVAIKIPKGDYASDEILTLEEASKCLKIGKKTLYNLCKEGKLPCYKIGREWRFLRRVLMEWLARGVTSEKSC